MKICLILVDVPNSTEIYSLILILGEILMYRMIPINVELAKQKVYSMKYYNKKKNVNLRVASVGC